MDPRQAFLKSASTLVHGFFQLTQYRITGNTAQMCILDVHVRNRELYRDVELPIVTEIMKITPADFSHYVTIFQESSVVLAFSWLESFLAEVEEALYLQNPAHLGEQIQVKLGKILDAGSLEELLHDIVRRRVRDRSQWSLSNRFADLKEHHGFTFASAESDVEWMSLIRNKVIHDRRIGLYQVKKKRVTYEPVADKKEVGGDEAQRFLHIAANSIVDLYDGASRALKITSRNAQHREIVKVIASWRKLWAPEPLPSNLGVHPTPASGHG